MVVDNAISPEDRLKLLDRKLNEKDFVRVIEAHNGLSALIGENTRIDVDGEVREFDAFWESSLTDTAGKGLPDVEIVGYDSRSDTIDQILNVTSKPMIVDGDTGGAPTQFEYFVAKLQRLGVSAVIIEDKTFPKRNSLDQSANQQLEDPEKFAEKIIRGNGVKIHDEFRIIARLESLIAGVGIDDAVARAERYIEAGVDGIMIHSKDTDPKEILEFADIYAEMRTSYDRFLPLVAVPTTYNRLTDQELENHGFNIVIHANHLLRSSHRIMKDTATTILETDRNLEADELCSPVSEVFHDVGFDRIKALDKK